MEAKLIGDWFGTVAGDQIHMEFRRDGNVLYEIYSDHQRQSVLLTYRVDGDMLVTDQPSHPQEIRTQLRFDSGKLVVVVDGVETVYERLRQSPN